MCVQGRSKSQTIDDLYLCKMKKLIAVNKTNLNLVQSALKSFESLGAALCSQSVEYDHD